MAVLGMSERFLVGFPCLGVAKRIAIAQHRDALAALGRRGEQPFGNARAFAAKDQIVAVTVSALRIGSACLFGQQMQAVVGGGKVIARKEILPAGIGRHVQVLPVAQAGATHRFVVERKAQWLHQMQAGAGDHAGTADITRIGRNLGRIQHDIEHESPWHRTKNHHEGAVTFVVV